MMRRAAAIVAIVLAGACASQKPDNEPPSLVPPADLTVAPANDPRVAELQTSMTELLERIDVLNARIARLETPIVTAPPQVVAPPAVPTQSPAPQPVAQPSSALHSAQLADAYRNALMLYGRSKFAEARTAFQQVFDADPSGELADNALFWIGETWFTTGDYQNAMRYYARVTKEYAEQNKAPDAMFKTGIAYERIGDLGMARKTFQEVIARYTFSTAAASAKQELQRIKY